MIKHITGYRDGGTISILLSHFGSLSLKYETTKGLTLTPELLGAMEGCTQDLQLEICIDNKCDPGNPYKGRWTIGYPTKPYACEIKDLSIKEWIIQKVEEYIGQQRYYLSEIKTLTKQYV